VKTTIKLLNFKNSLQEKWYEKNGRRVYSRLGLCLVLLNGKEWDDNDLKALVFLVQLEGLDNLLI
jgi:hypothetical protein